MLKNLRKTRGQSTMEYIAVLMFILAAFLIFQKYLTRGISGRWKSVGDAIGQGRIYSINSTECAFDIFDPSKDRWYEVSCFDQFCYDSCYVAAMNVAGCSQCIDNNSCNIPFCN